MSRCVVAAFARWARLDRRNSKMRKTGGRAPGEGPGRAGVVALPAILPVVLRSVRARGVVFRVDPAPGSVMTRMTSCPACGAMISANASTCPRCGAVFNRTLVAPVGIALMLAIAVLYAIFQRFW